MSNLCVSFLGRASTWTNGWSSQVVNITCGAVGAACILIWCSPGSCPLDISHYQAAAADFTCSDQLQSFHFHCIFCCCSFFHADFKCSSVACRLQPPCGPGVKAVQAHDIELKGRLFTHTQGGDCCVVLKVSSLLCSAAHHLGLSFFFLHIHVRWHSLMLMCFFLRLPWLFLMTSIHYASAPLSFVELRMSHLYG